MNRVIAFAALFMAAPIGQSKEPVSFPKLLDTTGQPRALGESPKLRGIALVFLGPECPLCQRYAPTIQKLAKEKPDGIEIYAVVSGSSVTRLEAVKYSDDYKPGCPVLFDSLNELAARYKPTHVPEAFVLDARGEILYRGRIDDWYEAPGKPKATVQNHDFRDAMIAVAAGKPVPNKITKPIGCHFEDDLPAFGSAPAKVTFHRHIAPILRAQCADCHRPGEVAPFSLLTFADASKRAKQLLEAVDSGAMPPWHASRPVNHFLGERRLTGTERAALTAWVEAGAPEGEPTDAIPAMKATDGWQLGKPDLIIRMPDAFTIPATGPDIIRNFVIGLADLQDDKYVTAMEIRPGNRKVVHHGICYLDTTGAGRKLDAADPKPGYESYKGGLGFLPTGALGGYAPGSTTRHVPEGTGRFLAKRSDAVLQMHYHPSGKVETDQTEVGIYFSKKAVKNLLFGVTLENWDIDIPAGEKRYERNAEYTLPAEITVVLAAPHMHRLGTEMTVWAELPSGEKRTMIDVDKWDFNQQEGYYYRKPFTLPKGTKLKMRAVFDNSGNKERVTYGERTVNEMALCIFECTANNLNDLFLILGDQLKVLKLVERFTEPAKK